jgi:uncharacterized protein YkwD
VSSHRVSAGAASLALLSVVAAGCGGGSSAPAASHGKLPATVAATTLASTRPAAQSAAPKAAGGVGAKPKPHPKKTKAKPHPKPAPVTTGSNTIVQAVLRQINAARAAAGLPAYTLSSGLDTSAGRHTSVMAGGCGLSHQCPGEAGLGPRISAAGISWNAVGENIGEGGPEPATTAAEIGMAEGLTRSMLAEKPPNDGHRKNLLSSAYHRVGISVYRSSSGTVWMTQDFAN